MGEHEFELGPGQLYFIEPDGTYSLLGHVTDVECTAEDNDIPEVIANITDCEAAFEMLAKVSQDCLLAITGMAEAIISYCPEKRVAHLAVHGKTARIRKKNFYRAIKILEEMDD